MVTDGHPDQLAESHSPVSHEDRDPCGHIGDPPQFTGDTAVNHGDTSRVTAGRQPPASPPGSTTNHTLRALVAPARPGDGLRSNCRSVIRPSRRTRRERCCGQSSTRRSAEAHYLLPGAEDGAHYHCQVRQLKRG